MPYQKYSIVLQKLELRSKALAANIEETPELVVPLARLDGFLASLRELTTEQARLTAARQEVSRQIAELMDKAQKLMTFVDLGVKQHYGNRSEKLVEYSVQPFRGKPRTRRVGPDGKPLKKTVGDIKAPATPETE